MSEQSGDSTEQRLREQAWKIGYLHAIVGQKDRELQEAHDMIASQSGKLVDMAARVASLELLAGGADDAEGEQA